MLDEIIAIYFQSEMSSVPPEFLFLEQHNNWSPRRDGQQRTDRGTKDPEDRIFFTHTAPSKKGKQSLCELPTTLAWVTSGEWVALFNCSVIEGMNK